MILYCFPALRPDHYNVRCPIVRCGATLYQSFLWNRYIDCVANQIYIMVSGEVEDRRKTYLGISSSPSYSFRQAI